MLEDKRPPPLNILQIGKKQASSTGQHEVSPNLTTTARRRRTKFEKVNAKTNEDLIQQSHQLLMNYIDNVDNEVKNLLDNQEAQFFIAYRKHSSKVKQQMKEIKNKMLENTQNEKVFIERINYLQKELILFRDQTLRMSEKLIAKNDQIDIMRIKLKDALAQNKHHKELIAELTKTNMNLSAKLIKYQNQTLGLQTETIKIDKLQNEGVKIPNDKSHLSHLSHLKHPNVHLRIRNYQKMTASKIIASTIQQKGNNHLAIGPSQRHQSIDDKADSIKTDLSNTNRKRSNSFRAKIERSRLIQTQIQKFRSKSFAQRNEYQKIFIDCVEQVRNGIMRKGFNESLNYFKQNGPKSLVQFKKLDYFVLLELFLNKDTISKKLYQLIFEGEKQ